MSFILERRNRETIRSSRRKPKAFGGNGVSEACSDEVGVNDDEGPPVPIPNTEVKLVGGENTCLATDREDSTMPTSDSSCKTAAAVVFYPQPGKYFQISSNRSSHFDWKRRSSEALCSFHGAYGSRGNGASGACSDAKTARCQHKTAAAKGRYRVKKSHRTNGNPLGRFDAGQSVLVGYTLSPWIDCAEKRQYNRSDKREFAEESRICIMR